MPGRQAGGTAVFKGVKKRQSKEKQTDRENKISNSYQDDV